MNSQKTILLKTGTLHFSQGTHNAYLRYPKLLRTFRKCLYRHYQKEWKDQPEYISQANQLALERGGQILTIHINTDHYPIVIVTEACRSFTTILFESEYK